jgi:Ca-activated chloride channel family protein
MPSYGRSGTVRSHRPGGRKRRTRVGPALLGLIAIVVVSTSAFGAYMRFVRDSCTGSAQATIIATPRIAPILQTLAVNWADTSPSVNGACGSVTIEPREAPAVANDLTSATWNPDDGAAPDVWVPDASAWAREAAANRNAEPMLPDLQPSLARTPTVIAVPQPLADAAGLTGASLTWAQVVAKLNVPGGWKAYGHPEWGAFKVGLSDPQQSTPGLLALMAISDANDDGQLSQAEQTNLLNLRKVITVKASSTADILAGLHTADQLGQAQALTYVSAFPALEQDVLDYNLAHPKVPLVAIYPSDGTAEADFPYLVLNAPWAQAQRQAVANAFLAYARTQGRPAFLDAGLRDSNRVPGPQLVSANGVEKTITALPRAVLLPDAVQHAAASWTAVTRPTNMLLVFDTSGSMDDLVEGTGGKSRLDLTKTAALNALSLLDGSARVGVWSFSTFDAGQDYRQLVPIAAMSSTNDDGASHADAVRQAIEGLTAGGNTGLYNTAYAACQSLAANRVDGAANMIVLLTDGADDNNIPGSLTLPDLVTKLRSVCGNPAHPVQLITIGLGVKADSAILRQISDATGASSYSSPTSFDINQVMLSALFS